ncbi:MAG: hypothetical protein SVV03_05960 [Candidatus Nanohaloarchaea archaeon]|nr:hypothetical protein [Candidatus Nanohaloarchaea archaeon]
MSLVTIQIREKHLYILAVLVVLLFGGMFLASAQAGQGQGKGKGLDLSPEEIREKLEKEIPAAWKAQPQGQQGQGQGQGEGSTGATNVPQATHSASGVKVVFEGEVITLQEALNALEKRTSPENLKKSLGGVGIANANYFDRPVSPDCNTDADVPCRMDVTKMDAISDDAKMVLVTTRTKERFGRILTPSISIKKPSSSSWINILKSDFDSGRRCKTRYSGTGICWMVVDSKTMWFPLEDGKIDFKSNSNRINTGRGLWPSLNSFIEILAEMR